MSRLHTAALLAAGFAVGCTTSPPPQPQPEAATRRTLATGEVVGFASAYGSHAWLGIPYAAPPVGELRWKAPRPPEPWSGTREALRFGPRCPQLASPLEGAGDAGTPVGEEDCLEIHVWAPAFAPDEVPQGDARLPVMLWIHGGGNTIGSGSFYDGGHLAAQQDVVVLTFNYRLGPLGWFRHAALAAGEDALDASGNYGTLDVVQALRWIRENIAAFGGDPERVTVFGESAGGHDTVAMLVSPQARGLFHRAVVQSGGSHTATLAEAENFIDDPEPGHASSSNEVLLTLLQRDGRAADRAAARAQLARMSEGEIATYLRGRSPAALLLAYVEDPEEPGLGMIEMPQLFRDGTVLPSVSAEEWLAAGRHNRVPTILGTTRDENKLFLFMQPEHVRYWFGFLPRLRDPERYEAEAEYLSRSWKARAVDGLARGMLPHQPGRVFAYRFDWDEEPTILFSDLSKMLGAAHAFEIPFVFGHWDLGPESGQLFDEENERGRLELSSAMMSYWAQFAYTGDPGRGRDGSLPAWEPYGDARPGSERMLVLDTSADGGIRMSSEGESIDRLVADLARDERLPEPGQKCDVLDDLERWWPSLAGSGAAATLGCAASPVATSGE